MLKREDWLPLARKLDWTLTYVAEEEAFPPVTAGKPWLTAENWRDWDEPFQTTYTEYVANQSAKDASVYAVRDALGRTRDFEKLPSSWLDALKLHGATLPLAEFAAVVGNLRAARFGRDSAWRNMALFGALDEFRHTQIPLVVMHELVKWDAQFDWTHKFYHSNNWIAVAGRHIVDELLLASDPIEFAIATNFVFETGFTNLQFIGLSSLAHNAGDKMFEKMIGSIQTDEARHAQIGPAVLKKIVAHDPEYAQYLLDKWFWRSWHLFAIVTGFSMDYLTPLAERTQSFKEFMREWVIGQYLETLADYGMKRPWYWETFLESLDSYHHMVYASAYTYRATTWFNFVVPSPQERAWLRRKYPKHWQEFDRIWQRIDREWEENDPGNEFGVHGTSIVGFCDLCQIVLSEGTPQKNTARTLVRDEKKYIFCSDPCQWIFEREPERYADHKDLVKRVIAGEAPANLVAMLRQYMGLKYDIWGKDAHGGDYPWIRRAPRTPKEDG